MSALAAGKRASCCIQALWQNRRLFRRLLGDNGVVSLLTQNSHFCNDRSIINNNNNNNNNNNIIISQQEQQQQQRRWFQSSCQWSKPSTFPSPVESTMESTGTTTCRVDRTPMKPYPRSHAKLVPHTIHRPPYAKTGRVDPPDMSRIYMHNDSQLIQRMKNAAQLARQALDLACQVAQPGMTTDDVDTIIHNALIDHGAYPSPLNYAGFPKSICSSVNEVICHGIPDLRPLQFGDVVSFDISCFYQGVHGDNCATIIVGDQPDGFDFASAESINDKPNYEDGDRDWRGVPYKTDLLPGEEQEYFDTARRLVRATREALYAAIDTCRPGSCLSDVGNTIQDVADAYGFQTVEKYRGHGISHEFHCAPFVKHFRNSDRLELRPGMIFTIEPMLVLGDQTCLEWNDQWTVATLDKSLAAQFEHTVLIREDGVEILTLP